MNTYTRSVRAQLDPESDDYIHGEARRLGITVSSVIRQCIDARRAAQKRAAEIDREIAKNEAGAY